MSVDTAMSCMIMFICNICTVIYIYGTDRRGFSDKALGHEVHLPGAAVRPTEPLFDPRLFALKIPQEIPRFPQHWVAGFNGWPFATRNGFRSFRKEVDFVESWIMISNGRSPSRKRTDMSSGPLRGFVADHHDAARSVDLSELVAEFSNACCMLFSDV